jgi:hypothetical protein
MQWAVVAGHRPPLASGYRFAPNASPRQCAGRAWYGQGARQSVSGNATYRSRFGRCPIVTADGAIESARLPPIQRTVLWFGRLNVQWKAARSQYENPSLGEIDIGRLSDCRFTTGAPDGCGRVRPGWSRRELGNPKSDDVGTGKVMGRVGQFVSHLLGVVPREEREGIRIEDPCWEVAGEHVDQSAFFRGLSKLVGGDAILFLEGGPHPTRVRRFLEDNAVPARARVALGTIWPRRTTSHLPTTSAVLYQLADLAEHCASPELCDHLHVYYGEKVLLQWYDAFADPFYVSKEVPLRLLQQFCAELGVWYKDGLKTRCSAKTI